MIWNEYKDVMVIAKIPSEKRITPARLLGKDPETGDYIFHCGCHDRNFTAPDFYPMDEFEPYEED